MFVCDLQSPLAGPGPHRRPQGGPLVSSSSTSPWSSSSSSSSVFGPQVAAAMVADFRRLRQVRLLLPHGPHLLDWDGPFLHNI